LLLLRSLIFALDTSKLFNDISLLHFIPFFVPINILLSLPSLPDISIRYFILAFPDTSNKYDAGPLVPIPTLPKLLLYISVPAKVQ
jgi:hypothetical protein